MFNFLSRTDLTGSVVRALEEGTDCKKIAMFCGSGRFGIGCRNDVPPSDNLFRQMCQASTWGRKYLTVPNATRTVNYYPDHPAGPGTAMWPDGQSFSGICLRQYDYPWSVP